MHKTRAIIKIDASGKPVAAFPKGYSCNGNSIEEDWKTEEEGYILTCLKKATSRNKGNELEREVAKVFSNWLYDRPDILARTPLSGGWEGSKLGDITGNPAKLMELNLSMPKIYVECKNREGLLSETFFNWLSTGSPKTIDEWIEDTTKKAGPDNKWFLVLKGRGTEPWVLTPRYPGISQVGFVIEGFYNVFPLKQLQAAYMYCDLKEQIIKPTFTRADHKHTTGA